jgi:drug/metabolite transporter (DMT)-like permease
MSTALLTGFLLALAASLFWSFLDITRKWLGSTMTATGAVAGLALFQLPFFGLLLLIGTFLPGKGMAGLLAPLTFPQASFWWWWGAAVPLHVVSNLLFLRAVQLSPFSLTIPYLSFTPVFSALFGLWILSEAPSGWGWLGIGIVCLGAFFLNPGNRDDGIFAPLKALWTERGSFYMLLVAMMWSLTPILDKKAAVASSISLYLLLMNIGIALSFVAIRQWKTGSLRTLWKEWEANSRLLWLSGGIAMAAMVFQMASFTFLPVAYMETVKRGIGLLAAIAAGVWLFKEESSPQRFLSVVVMMAGIALLLLAS